MPRIELDRPTTITLDTLREPTGLSRGDYLSRVLDSLADGDLVHHDPAPDPAELIIDEAVERATEAFADHRPGYGEFILTRAAMAVVHIEELRSGRVGATPPC